MSSDRTREIQQLLEQLTTLRIQVDELRHQETSVLQELSTLLIIGNPTTDESNVPIATVPTVTATLVNEEQEEEDFRPVQRARNLRPGDRVRILNSVSNIVGDRPATDSDRICTVRRVTSARRVLITTDSGVNTWRYSNNLALSPRHHE